MPASIGANSCTANLPTDNRYGENAQPGAKPPARAPAERDHARVSARAKQTIPRALRRAVLLRDQHSRCVPGCRNATFVDLHHIQLRSEGGRNELGNIITLCGSHHRAAHRGMLLIKNDAGGGLRFRHAGGAAYGCVLAPEARELQTKLFSALRHLGFKEREVRTVLAELRAEADLRAASLQNLLREALRRLHPAQARHWND
jgi:hypothetical protein